MILRHVAFRFSCCTIRYCCFPELQFIFSSKSLFCWTECPSILLLLTTRLWDMLSYIGIQCNLLSGSAAFWGTCWLWWAYFYVISTDRKLSTSIGYDRLPNSKPQGQLRRFLLCYLQVCKYVLFPVWGIILFGILISAVLTRCQSSNATLLCWIFGFQFFASMFSFFFFVSWECLIYHLCNVIWVYKKLCSFSFPLSVYHLSNSKARKINPSSTWSYSVRTVSNWSSYGPSYPWNGWRMNDLIFL
jgi:hypothetical protein